MIASYLYVPMPRAASLLATLDSLDGFEADAVVLDLEDSIHVSGKAAARQALLDLDLSPLTDLGVPVCLRINTIASYHGLADLVAVRELCSRPDRALDWVLLPKVRHPAEVGTYRRLFETLPAPPRLCTFIETTEAVEHADGIAAVSDALHYGQADLSADLYSPNPAYFAYAVARVVVAAARHGIPAIDTNSFEIHDMAAVAAECAAGRAAGFTGKAAIHPRQVAPINAAFSVAAETVKGYQATVDAYDGSDAGFRIVEGNVIAMPFVTKARRMLALYQS